MNKVFFDVELLTELYKNYISARPDVKEIEVVPVVDTANRQNNTH